MLSLDKDKIKDKLTESCDIKVLPVIDSTNNYLKEAVKSGLTDTTAVLAERQTDGRGRRGRTFYSPENTGLYLSVYKKLVPDDLTAVTIKTAVAVCRGIENITGKAPSVKWVNDLYLNNKKICGILTEPVWENDGKLLGAVIGVGINCFGTAFPKELSEIAGCISKTDDFDRNSLAAEVISQILKSLDESTKSIISEYKSRCFAIGKKIEVISDKTEEGTALDIDDVGGLVVRMSSGEIKTLTTGEISIKLYKEREI